MSETKHQKTGARIRPDMMVTLVVMGYALVFQMIHLVIFGISGVSESFFRNFSYIFTLALGVVGYFTVFRGIHIAYNEKLNQK